MPVNQLIDVFRMAEAHGVAITFSFSDKWHSAKIDVRKDNLAISRYIRFRDVYHTEFVFDLIRDMISEIEKKEACMEREKKPG